MNTPSTSTTKNCGDFGERAAARYLMRRFYRILERNWFFYRKEIDIIARRGSLLVICEVKTRTQEPDAPSLYGTPADAVDAEKRKNLRIAARGYLSCLGKPLRVRMDIIEVYLKKTKEGEKKKVARIVHIKNAFPA